MYTVIKSLLGRPSSDVRGLVDQILSFRPILISEELQVFDYISSALDSAGEAPSETLFVAQFPDFEVYLAAASALEVKDVRVHFLLLMDERKKMRASSKLISLANDVQEKGVTGEIFDQIRKLRSESSQASKTATPLVIGASFSQIYEERASRPVGLMTFVKELDNAIGGMGEGSLNTIMGFVGSFKTTSAINIAYNNAMKLGYNIVYVSLEMAREDLWFNFICRHSLEPQFDKYPFIGHDRIRKGLLTPEEKGYLEQVVIPDLDSQKGRVVVLETSDFASRDPDDLLAKLEELDDLIPGGIDAVIWDHIQMLKFVDSRKFGMDEKAVMNSYVNQFMEWAKDFRGKRTVKILLAQTNRTGWAKAAKHGGMYDLLALAEVNEAERASARVISIYTDENLKSARECMVQILKSRFGVCTPDPISVKVDPECCVFGGEMDDMGVSVSAGNSDLDTMFGGGDSLGLGF